MSDNDRQLINTVDVKYLYGIIYLLCHTSKSISICKIFIIGATDGSPHGRDNVEIFQQSLEPENCLTPSAEIL